MSRFEGMELKDSNCRLLPRKVNSAEIFIQFDELSRASVEIVKSSNCRGSSTQTLEGFKPSPSSNEIILSIKDERVEKTNPFDGRHKVFDPGEGFALPVVIIHFDLGKGDVFQGGKLSTWRGGKGKREGGEKVLPLPSPL